MPPDGFATWTDYWNSLADIQNENNPPAPGDQPRATTSGSPTGFTPVTNPGYTNNNVGTGPVQQDPGASNYGQNIQTNYNPAYYADDATAQRIAQQLGGTVIKSDPFNLDPNGPFSAPNANMIQLPNGRVIDAGTIAGYEQVWGQSNPAMLQALINGEVTGTGQNYQAYPQNYNNYNPSAAAQPGFNTNQLPAGSVVNTGGITGGGGGTGGGGTPGGGTPSGNQRDPSMSLALNYRPPARTVTDANAPSATNTGGTPDWYNSSYPQVGTPTGMPYGAGAMGGFPTKTITNPDGSTSTVPDWSYKPTSNVGDMLQNSLGYAYGQGGELIGNYGTLMAQEQQRANQLASTGDSMYSALLANPGYTATQQAGIMDQSGLNALNWTPDMANANFLTSWTTDANGNAVPGEQQAWAGDPYAAYKQYTQGNTVPIMDANGNVQRDANGNIQYQSNADYLNQLARQYGGNLSNIYDQGSTAIGGQLGTMGAGLSAAIDPSKLGLSSQFTTNYNWTPQDSQNIINAAGRNVGMQTAAIQDQLQRQAAAAGTGAPLALSAALARQRQTGDVAGADAMTQAAIQAKQNELQVQQQLEQMRLGTQQDISTRQMQEATTMGQSGIAAEENLLSGRAGAALQTGLQQMNEQNTIAGTESQLTQQGEIAAQQRAQAMAQNRQQISQANQAAQFQRGSYTDQATSQRNTQMADAARADQTQARQDVRNEEQTGYNEANSGMAGQLQAFSGVTGAGQASQANVIKAAQLPTTLDKFLGAGSTALSAEGGVYNKPTKAIVGEKGPEIVIKLKHMGGGPMSYRRRNEAAYA